MRRWILSVVLPLLAAGAGDSLQAQGTGRISGTVTSDAGRPLPAATVTILGTTRGALTDDAGRYSITSVPDGAHRVQARLIGYSAVTNDVTVSGGSAATSNFQLRSAPVQLEGVTVVGYGTQERRTVTGAVATVQEAQLKEVPTDNPVKALQGRVPGVEIVAGSNLPGSGMNIRIRGVRSLTASNDPLYVVDGIPLSGGIGDFNPANIERIEILKDASATAIYGSRGSNGVVIITTKSGTSAGMKTQFTIDSYYGQQKPIRLVELMNSQEYVAYLRESARYAGVDTSLAVILTPLRLKNFQNGVSTDWQRELLRDGQQKNYQLGLNGANADTRFSLSGNFFDQDGLAEGQGYRRASGSASVDHTIRKLRLGLSANGARSTQQIGAGDGLWGFAFAQTPLGTPFDSNGVLIARPDDEPLQINPIANQRFHIREVTRNRIFASAFSELELPVNGLKWRVNFGPDITNSQDGTFWGSMTNDRQLGTPRGQLNQNETFAYTLDNLLTFNRDLGTAHRVDFTGLYSIQKQRGTSENVASTDLPYSEQLWYNLGSGTVQSQSSNLQEFALESLMGRLSYTLLDRYTVTLTSRYDGSSRLAEGNKWASFPSVGLAWQVGDEPFLQPLTGIFSALKLRGSFGVTGNTAIAPYQTQGALSRRRYNFGAGNAFGYAPGSIPNPSLSWEKTGQLDFGLEFGVLDNRVSGTVDWYQAITKDILMNRALPATSGFTQTLQNIGRSQNTGVEVALSTQNLRNWNGLSWSSDINFTTNRNRIVALAGGVTADIGNGWWVGMPINLNGDGQRRVWYDYKKIGVWQIADSALARTYGYKPGQIRVQDVNGDGRIDLNNDRVFQGNTYAKWTGSLYNRFAFKGLDLSALATGKFGYTFYDDFQVNANSLQGRFGNIKTTYWTPENPTDAQPAPGYNGAPVALGSTRAYTEGSHWRIRNITLGYTVGPRLLRNVRADGLRLYLTAQEPFVFTDYEGYDPENGTGGGSPPVRTLLFGANVSW